MIPSRSALIAFEAAARHQSFTGAASELALTESAVSRQIATLEDLLSIKLFNRTNKRVFLTRAGEIYGTQVRKTIAQIERDMFNIMAHGGTRDILELAVLPTFCSQWLIPRLGSFYKQNPDISINTTARSVMFLFKDTPIDAAIHFGQPNWPGTIADYLFKEDVVAVCKPDLLKDQRPINAEGILSHPLLHLSSRPDAWRVWLEGAGLAGHNTMKGSRHEHFSHLICAASSGLGIALIPRFLIGNELEQGELTIAFDMPTESDNAYYLVYPENNLSESALVHFREWLLEEVNTFQG
jgi:DNA-binding transcriptional LysR family regulator